MCLWDDCRPVAVAEQKQTVSVSTTPKTEHVNIGLQDLQTNSKQAVLEPHCTVAPNSIHRLPSEHSKHTHTHTSEHTLLPTLHPTVSVHREIQWP